MNNLNSKVVKFDHVKKQAMKKDGVIKTYYNNGQLESEANYKNGELDGSYKVWYKDGQLKGEANYKNGKKEGVCKDWNESGKLRFEDNFKNGKLTYKI